MLLFLAIGLFACESRVFVDDSEYNDFLVSGQSKMGNGDLKGAIEDLGTAVGIKQTPETYVLLSQAKLWTGDAQGALEEINNALQMKGSRNNSDYFLRRAEIEYVLNDFPEALKDTEKALIVEKEFPINKNEGWIYSVRSKIKFDMGDKQGALDDINSALLYKDEIAESNKGLYYAQRAKMKFDMDDPKAALEDLNEAIKIIEPLRDSGNTKESVAAEEIRRIYQQRADVKLALDDKEGAEKDIEKSKTFK
jgi:tetratricopeptide (TPR) repeat protein